METKKRWKKVLDVISNIIFVIVLLLLVVFMVYGFGSISQDKAPSFFGQYYFRISTTSMTDPVYSIPGDEESTLISEGFAVNDIVIVNEVNTKEIKVGDIIGYYEYSGTTENPVGELVPVDSVDESTIQEVWSSGSRYSGDRVFHQVVSISVDSEGTLWFETQGSSNSSSDPYLVRADYVIGRYTDSALAGILEFIASPVGIVVLVVVPSCIVMFLLLISIINTIDKMIKKKKK